MRIRNGPPGPSMVCSRTSAISAGDAIKAMRASYCARATSTGSVCVAGAPVPLSSRAWIWGSTGIAVLSRPRLLRRVCDRGRTGRQKTIEHLARTIAEPRVVRAVEHPDAVDEHAVHADRVAQRARAAAGQVVDPARWRNADRGGVEQQQISMCAEGDAAAVRDAIEPGLMTCQPAHALRKVESAALAHPMAEEIEAEPGIAQIHQMRAGVRQRDHSRLVFDQRLHPVVDSIEKPADQPGIEVLLEPKIEQHVERIPPGLACDVGYRAIAKPGILGPHRRGHDDSLPVALEHGTRLRVTQIGAERASEARITEHLLQLLSVVGLDRVERRTAVEWVGACQREVERQGLTSDLDVEFIAARLRRPAGVEYAECALRILLVIERDGGAHKDAAPVAGSDLFHGVGRDRAGGDLDNAAPRPAHRPDQRVEFRYLADRRRHRHAPQPEWFSE